MDEYRVLQRFDCLSHFMVKESCRRGRSLLAQQHTVHAQESCCCRWCPGRGHSLWTHTLTRGEAAWRNVADQPGAPTSWPPGKEATGSGPLVRLNVLVGHKLRTTHVGNRLLILRGFFLLMDAHVQDIFLTCSFTAEAV